MIRNLNPEGNQAYYMKKGENPEDDQVTVVPIVWENQEEVFRLAEIPDDSHFGIDTFGNTKDPRKFMVLYNAAITRPFSAVLVVKCMETGEDAYLVDVDEEDSDFITFVRDNYLDVSGEIKELTVKIKPALTPEEAEKLTALGCALQEGDLYVQDYDAAHTAFVTAGRAGDIPALYHLAGMYRDGLGMDPDPAAAVELYGIAADSGYVPALLALGELYESGGKPNGKPDYERGLRSYELAAQAGDVNGMFHYARFLHFGYGTPPDEEKALLYFQKLADGGLHDGAYYYMGLYCQEGRGGQPKDDLLALKYYRKGARKGNAACCRQLGIMYENGLGTRKNLKKAMENYQKAADLGDAAAFVHLAKLWENGALGASDLDRAILLYQMAAQMGEESAEVELNRLALSFQCPACGKYYFIKRDSFEVCPACGWVDDPEQRKDPDRKEGANSMSLNEYRIQVQLNEW